MARIVLIHGSWHGAWCWYKVKPRLEALGHTVAAPDLPGHGRDWRAPAGITLDDYVACAAQALGDDPEPATVVAHSRGGLVLSALAEAMPERVANAVYLAAVLLQDGETVFDIAAHAADSLIFPAMFRADDGSWDMLREDAYDAALYADCSAEDRALAHLLLTPEPLAPSCVPTRTTAERFGRVRRVYVELTEDRAVPPGWQRFMHGRVPCAEVRQIAASHSAYFSRADELARHIDAIARHAAG
ncbi:MAG: alpha/beta fold hydrolase [Gammaproteobacteria bacterium]